MGQPRGSAADEREEARTRRSPSQSSSDPHEGDARKKRSPSQDSSNPEEGPRVKKESPRVKNPSAPLQATLGWNALPVDGGAKVRDRFSEQEAKERQGRATSIPPAQAPQKAVENDQTDLVRTAQGDTLVNAEAAEPQQPKTEKEIAN